MSTIVMHSIKMLDNASIVTQVSCIHMPGTVTGWTAKRRVEIKKMVV